MSGAIFFETLRRNWRSTLLWGAGIALMGLYIVVIIPDVKVLKQYGELLKSMPSFLINAMGGGDAAMLATPEGFLAYGFFGWIMLVLAAYGVLAGLNITANEEDRGILDVLLSLPVPRWRVIVEKFLAYTVVIVVMVAMGFFALWLGVQRSTVFTISTAKLLESTFNMVPPTLVVMAFTALAATLARRRSIAAAVAAAYVVASYFIDIVGRSADSAASLRAISFYSYYDSTGVMQHGLAWGNVGGLLAAMLVMVVGAVWAFQRRDINV
jgi:ABC-2 type transport system permease protein